MGRGLLRGLSPGESALGVQGSGDGAHGLSGAHGMSPRRQLSGSGPGHLVCTGGPEIRA